MPDRVEEDMRDLAKRMGAAEQALASLKTSVPYIQDKIDDVAEDCSETRRIVQSQETRHQAAEREEKRITTQQKVAIVGAVALVLASLVGAVASLAAAGVF